jgi:cysteine-S-conjugate beta-lyase
MYLYTLSFTLRTQTLRPRMCVRLLRMSETTAVTGNPLIRLSLDELRQRTSMKWRTHPEDVLPLWVAEMDVLLAPQISSALQEAIQRGDTGYARGTRYAEAISDFAARRWSWRGIDVAHTAVVPDVMVGIVEILRLVTQPRDVVVVCPPVYAPFFAFVTHADRRIAEAPLRPDGRLDLDNLDNTFRQARAACANPVFLMSNPHNPTGVAHTRAELERVAALAQQHGVRVISDEIHAPLVLGGATFTPYLSVPGAEDAFALLSATKAWNLAGLKAALIVAGPAAADDLARMPEEVSHGPSHLGVIAHTAAFHDAGPWLDDLLRGLAANRDLLANLLQEHLPAVHHHRPESTYLAWIDCTALNLPTQQGPDRPAVVSDLCGPARYFLDQARVALSSGHVFGTGGQHHVRLNFATNPEILTQAITRLGQSVNT